MLARWKPTGKYGEEKEIAIRSAMSSVECRYTQLGMRKIGLLVCHTRKRQLNKSVKT